MNKQKVEVIRKVAEELLASKSSGYKKVQLGTKKPVSLQVDGVAIGSPLGPTLANIFMCHLEKVFLKSFPEDQLPLIYKRYVDDVFLVFRSEDHVEPFLKFMNS